MFPARSAIAGLPFLVLPLALAPATPAESLTPLQGQITPTEADLRTSFSWGLDRIDQRVLPLDGRYEMASTGAGVTAYVVDSGIAAETEQLLGRVRPGFSAVDGSDGRTDCDGHGTFVASNLGGQTVGVAPGVTLVPVRVLGCRVSGDAGSDVVAQFVIDVVEGLDWIVRDHKEGVPAVANMSLTILGDPAVDAATQRVIDDGVTVVVASGNEGVDTCLTSPGRVPDAITVNASDSNDARMALTTLTSDYGPCSDIWAPGVDVLGPIPGQRQALMPGSGTSMASPHVAGAAARLLELDPTMTPAQVWRTMADLATPLSINGAQPGDPERLLYLPPSSAPGRVSEPRCALSGPYPRASWHAPSSDGGARIRGYLTRHRSHRSGWSPWSKSSRHSTVVAPGSDFVQIAAVSALGRGYVATVSCN